LFLELGCLVLDCLGGKLLKLETGVDFGHHSCVLFVLMISRGWNGERIACVKVMQKSVD
jgi:hypothetical protein